MTWATAKRTLTGRLPILSSRSILISRRELLLDIGAMVCVCGLVLGIRVPCTS